MNTKARYVYQMPGGCVNIKMPSYQCRDSHCEDKAISQPSYLFDSIPYTWEDGLYIEMALGLFQYKDAIIPVKQSP